MGKPTIYLGGNKGADQLRSNCEADQRLCFRYSDSTIPLLLKFQASSSFLWLYRSRSFFFFFFFFFVFCFFFFLFNSVLRPFQDYFSLYETGQSIGGRKRENPEKNHLAHPQAELGLSHMWPERGSNPHQTQR